MKDYKAVQSSDFNGTEEEMIRDKIILYWEKGEVNSPWFKCEGFSPKGILSYGFGSTKELAVDDLINKGFKFVDNAFED
jgi:hypothetical protein